MRACYLSYSELLSNATRSAWPNRPLETRLEVKEAEPGAMGGVVTSATALQQVSAKAAMSAYPGVVSF